MNVINTKFSLKFNIYDKFDSKLGQYYRQRTVQYLYNNYYHPMPEIRQILPLHQLDLLGPELYLHHLETNFLKVVFQLLQDSQHSRESCGLGSTIDTFFWWSHNCNNRSIENNRSAIFK